MSKTEEMEYKKLPLDEEGNLRENPFRLISPRSIVIVKHPKSGGTLSLCDVPKIFIGDGENGTDDFKPRNYTKLQTHSKEEDFVKTNKFGYIPSGIFQTVDELKRANNMDSFWPLLGRLDDPLGSKEKEKVYNDIIVMVNSMPFPIFAIDTITSLTELSNDAALFEYNKGVALEKRKSNIKKIDDWGGTYKIRSKFAEIKRFIENNASPFIQWWGHVGEKKKILRKEDDEATALDIALEGIQSISFTARAQAVCVFYRNSKGCFLDFEKKEETALGTRSAHLSNKVIKIADLLPDNANVSIDRPITYWKSIYPEINF